MLKLLRTLEDHLSTLVLLAVLVTAGGVLEREHAQRRAAERQAEAAELKLKGAIVAEQARSLTVVQGLQAQVRQLQREAPGAQVSQTLHVTTAPVQPAGTGCLVSATDKLQLRLDAVELKTRAGNYLLTGTGQVLKVDLTGAETVLLSAPLEASSQLAVKLEEPPQAPGWGLGALGVISAHGESYGVEVSPPPLRALGLQVELTVGVVTGPGGTAVLGGVLVRH